MGVLNSVSGLPVEWRAAQAAVHAATVYAFLVAFALMVLTRRRNAARTTD